MRRTIQVPHVDLSAHEPVYVNGQPRFGTATAVGFIDADTMVVGHFLGRLLFVLDVNTGAEIARIDVPGYVDLLDVDPVSGRIATANYPHAGADPSVTLFWWDDEGRTIQQVGHHVLPGLKPHGVRFDPAAPGKVVVCSTNDQGRIVSLDLFSGVASVIAERNMAPKDCIFVGESIYAAWAHGLPGTKVENDYAEIASLDGTDNAPFSGMPDCIAMDWKGSRIYVTVQDRHEVAVFEPVGDRFMHVRNLEGFRFPHGCAFAHGMLAVTNYGDNTVDIITGT